MAEIQSALETHYSKLPSQYWLKRERRWSRERERDKQWSNTQGTWLAFVKIVLFNINYLKYLRNINMCNVPLFIYYAMLFFLLFFCHFRYYSLYFARHCGQPFFFCKSLYKRQNDSQTRGLPLLQRTLRTLGVDERARPSSDRKRHKKTTCASDKINKMLLDVKKKERIKEAPIWITGEQEHETKTQVEHNLGQSRDLLFVLLKKAFCSAPTESLMGSLLFPSDWQNDLFLGALMGNNSWYNSVFPLVSDVRKTRRERADSGTHQDILVRRNKSATDFKDYGSNLLNSTCQSNHCFSLCSL